MDLIGPGYKPRPRHTDRNPYCEETPVPLLQPYLCVGGVTPVWVTLGKDGFITLSYQPGEHESTDSVEPLISWASEPAKLVPTQALLL